MASIQSNYNLQRSRPEDLERSEVETVARLVEARTGLGLSQADFSRQISMTRERLASYEEGRAPLRSDIALRACRHFFISELWLATGALTEDAAKKGERSAFSNLEARLTMALMVIPEARASDDAAAFSGPHGFNLYLRAEYASLALGQGGFPRVLPLPSDGPEYYTNAMNCLMQFWKRGLSEDYWRSFFSHLVAGGGAMRERLEGEPLNRRPGEQLKSLSPKDFMNLLRDRVTKADSSRKHTRG